MDGALVDLSRACMPASHPTASHSRYPNELFEYLRLVYLTKEDMGGRALREMEFTDPISLENELAAMASIEGACEEVSGKGGEKGGKEGKERRNAANCVGDAKRTRKFLLLWRSIFFPCPVLLTALLPPRSCRRSLRILPKRRTMPVSSTTPSFSTCFPRPSGWPLSIGGRRNVS